MPVAALLDRSIVRVGGPDATPFLQNLLTCDVAAVEGTGIGYGALLTPQGKILWDFILHKLAQGYAVDLRSDQADAFVKRLSLYKLRAKVEIAPAADLRVFAEWPNRGGLPADPRLAALGGRGVRSDPGGADASAADWHSHRIALAIPEGGIDFVFGDTFPHDAAMDSLHGVAFDKGCYIGQEVVSRMRHRGTARRRIVALDCRGAPPETGAEILAGGQAVGRLGSSADGHAIGLVRLDRVREALDAGAPITAGGASLSVRLPDWATYSWPAAAPAGDD